MVCIFTQLQGFQSETLWKISPLEEEKEKKADDAALRAHLQAAEVQSSPPITGWESRETICMNCLLNHPLPPRSAYQS